MLNRTRVVNKSRGVRLIAAGLILIITVVLTDIRVRPMIQKAGAYQCRVIATRIIDQVVYGEVEEYSYSELVLLSYDDGGSIISIESNMVNINRLKSRVTQEINTHISTIENTEVKIPIGTISGINLLYGRGAAIPVKLTPRGYCVVNLVSKFTSAGINQTLHQITLTVQAEVTAIIPGYTSSVLVETEFIVAQTVIVGYVPDSYTHIILGESIKNGL